MSDHLIESAPILSEGEVVADDGTVRLAIIRPCMSRGKRLQGLPPIYSAEMLRANASVFEGWPMFVDHVLSEGMSEAENEAVGKVVEILFEARRRVGRSVRDIGGRIIETWWDPNYTHPDDSKYGHEKGAIMAKAKPTPDIAALIEHDPELIHVSIHASPTGFRPATKGGRRGMLIEGIRSNPAGSVDWVVRPGAGGRVLTQEGEAEILSVVEGVYGDNHQLQGAAVIDFENMSDSELQEYLADNRPGVLKVVENESGAALSEDSIRTIVRDELAQHSPGLAEAVRREATLQTTRLIEVRESSAYAMGLIEQAADLGDKAKAALKAEFSLDADGANSLLAEAEPVLAESGEVEKTREQVVHEIVEGKIKAAREIIAEATGSPVVTGQGSGGEGGEDLSEAERESKAQKYAEHLVESGIEDSMETALPKARLKAGLPEKPETKE